MIRRRAFWILVLTFTLAVAANAGTLLVTGSGVWDADVPTTQYTAPGASWDFSFLIPDTIDVVEDNGGFYTTQATSFNYSLGGSQVTTVLAGVEFYTLSSGGLFDLYVPGATIGLWGDQAFSGTSTPLTLLPGVYAANSYGEGGSGRGTVTLAAESVPEPATWLLFAPALGLLALRRTARGRK